MRSWSVRGSRRLRPNKGSGGQTRWHCSEESSVRSYPSWIAEFRRKSPEGIDRRRYVYEKIAPGEPIELIRESAQPRDDHAVSFRHHGIHLGLRA
jgi:hypothetical protein